jgi:chromosome segregation ATPase
METEVKLGHNKLQIQIKELEEKVSALQKSNNEKDMKLGLLKQSLTESVDTIKDLREKSIEANKDSSDSDQYRIQCENLTKDLENKQECNNRLTKTIDNLNERISSIYKSHDTEMNGLRRDTETRYNTLKKDYHELKGVYERQVSDYSVLQDELRVLSDIMNEKNQVIESLNSNVLQYRTENDRLRRGIDKINSVKVDTIETHQESAPVAGLRNIVRNMSMGVSKKR